MKTKLSCLRTSAYLACIIVSPGCHGAPTHRAGPPAASPHRTQIRVTAAPHGFLVYAYTVNGTDVLRYQGPFGTPPRVLATRPTSKTDHPSISSPSIDATGRYVAFMVATANPDRPAVSVARISDGHLYRVPPPAKGQEVVGYNWSPSGSRLSVAVYDAGKPILGLWSPGMARARAVPLSGGDTLWNWCGSNLVQMDDVNDDQSLMRVRSSETGRVLAQWRVKAELLAGMTASRDGKWYAYIGKWLYVGRRGGPAKLISDDPLPLSGPLWLADNRTFLVQSTPRIGAGDITDVGTYDFERYVQEWSVSHPKLRIVVYWTERLNQKRARRMLDVSGDGKWIIFRDEVGELGKVRTEVVAYNRATKAETKLLSIPSLRPDEILISELDESIAWHETKRQKGISPIR